MIVWQLWKRNLTKPYFATKEPLRTYEVLRCYISMKSNLFILTTALFFSVILNACSGQKPSEYVSVNESIPMNTIHQFTVEDIEGNSFDFAALAGKRLLLSM